MACPLTAWSTRRAARPFAILLGLSLAGCESQAVQDPLLVRGSSNATVFGEAPIYVDRPLAENLLASVALADYVVLLQRAGLFDTLRAPGPYTVFALTDAAIESLPQASRDRILDPRDAAGLRRLMSYTIVPGRWTLATLRGLVAQGGGHATLRTLGGDQLTLSTDAAGEVSLADRAGRMSRFVLADIIQSNGLLYAGNQLLVPD